MFKKTLSMLLALAMLVSLLPVSAFAEGTEAAEPQAQMTDDVEFEAENSFGGLMVNTIHAAEASAAAEASYDSVTGEDAGTMSIVDLRIEGMTATVEYSTDRDADILVAIYTEDGSQMLASGTAAAPASGTILDVAIEADALPQYFRAAAFLLDADTHDPIGPAL